MMYSVVLTPSARGNKASAGVNKPNCPKFSVDERRLKLRKPPVRYSILKGLDPIDQAIDE